ncbi:1-(5-phosphoribosyl)-5-[(5-phosphoribosylamino)methylideneamino]imidazole-4-carboxamide isomerase [Candidatus Soleaferrea massiliensis]|uniref:1-(5-phosphoribosyl)-5-[(5- phosphoribosylamino)methylideneamino]imidazole-4- carboxamide isomerase n=1 Tax=Candidatus Soleaferrea massiliensis TaxID=1470354 RepID=UPI00058D8DA5|nr:1-(5-phosphoribosyl)-5-[(5-phosphoribosylamino)methylideneamino]imidazole-4-carboxamide isomerase [Candidatus Soleaferrea massiliensis]
MIILPAIDIKGGHCVRLYQGDFGTAEKVADSPYTTAASFKEAGAEWIHMVDLDGAKEAKRINQEIFVKVARESGLKVEVGGGIRTMEAVEYYLERGVSRVILGSAAVKDPAFVKEAVHACGERIAVGIDAKNGRVSCDGWLDDSDVDYIELAKRMEQVGVRCIIYTDISKDGTLAGPNLEQLDRINRAVSCDIIASGGISGIEDIRATRSLGLYGTICGKALYAGKLDLREAIETAKEGTSC